MPLTAKCPLTFDDLAQNEYALWAKNVAGTENRRKIGTKPFRKRFMTK